MSGVAETTRRRQHDGDGTVRAQLVEGINVHGHGYTFTDRDSGTGTRERLQSWRDKNDLRSFLSI